MIEWWNALGTAGQAFAFVAIPSSLILIIQVIMMCLGIGGHSDGGDVGHDGAFDGGLDGDFGGHDMAFEGHDVHFDGVHDIGHDGDIMHDGMPYDGAHDGIYGDDVTSGHHDFHPDHADSGLRLLTFRGIIAFLAVMGWTGIVMVGNGVNLPISIFVAVAAGFLAMLFIAVCMSLILKMQSNGTMDLRNAVGVSGTVYIPVPPSRTEKGKINIMLQGQYTELSAVTDEKEKLSSGQEIVVIGISGGDTVLVKKK